MAIFTRFLFRPGVYLWHCCMCAHVNLTQLSTIACFFAKTILWVKLKNVKLKDALLPCHSQNIVQDPQIARSHGFSSDNNTMEDEKSQANSQGNVNNENAVHDGNLSLGIGVLKQKRRHSLEFHNSMRKRQKPNCAEKQFTKAGVQDVHSRQNTTLCHVSSDSKMKLPAQDYTHDDGLVVSLPVSEITLGEPSSSMSSKERQQSEGINNVLESEPHITCDATKFRFYKFDETGFLFAKFAQSSSATSNNDQNQGRNSCRSVHEKKSENHAWIDRKPGGDSPDLKAKTTVEHKIDFATLFPLTRSPLVGKVSAFDYKSSEIVLIPAPEFEIFSEENPMSPTSLRAASPYKEDGSLQEAQMALNLLQMTEGLPRHGFTAHRLQQLFFGRPLDQKVVLVRVVNVPVQENTK
ncbi:hypothetical protein MA16_Dca022851 [Dendrobium catenatum]|uniref:Coilin tudor domain-containing protein n=1 Tax=Dendrobium catenatum TaxID=906689 RepID=A0A2I0X0A6_9ASPA|nr:hypothetical protein MA16_Dca022851 [Dendrobium catenatum]